MANLVLTKPQAKVWNSKKRFRVLVTGRRFGKTFLALTWLIHTASQAKGVYFYVAPTYPMAKTIAWRQLKELVEPYIINKNESELYVEFPNGSLIQLRSADNPDSLRGVSLSGLVLDEAAFMKEIVWTEVLRPATSDKEAPVLFISSPSGWNWFKDRYDYARYSGDENWEAFRFTTLEGGNVSEKELESAKRELDAKTFNQEYLASFESLSNRVYSAFDRDVHVTSDMNPHEHTQLYIGIDFNVDPMSACIAYKSLDTWFVFDEIILPNSNTYELAEEINRRYPSHTYKRNTYPDPSGKSRKTSAVGGTSDFTILSSAGLRVNAPNKAPAVSDRVNAVQRLFRSADGRVRLYVHPRCTELIKGLDGLTYKPKSNVPDKSLGLDHVIDSLGYIISYEDPILKAVPNISIKFSA